MSASPFGPPGPWLFDRWTDLLAFGGSAALSLGLLALAAALGVAEDDAPEWVWLSCVLAIDVAHVWSTNVRVYFDGAELRRRPLLYLGTPLLAYAAGAVAHGFGPAVFWRILAYAAAWHFVRQQAGWVALHARRTGARAWERRLDLATVYAGTLGPLLWWHAHPRSFSWFVPGDFLALPELAALTDALAVPALVLLGVFLGLRVVRPWARGEAVPWGTALVVTTTWACWVLGIVVFDGDMAFTVTNVLIHGVPYLVLTWRYGRRRARSVAGAPVGLRWLAGPAGVSVAAFLTFVLVAASLEEALWDRWVWHERPWLFGTAADGAEPSPGLLAWLVPLLALPQATHYLLDGFVWKRRSNPTLRASEAP
ncbi:MAG: hypothetical protein AAGH15_13485 [Myxococcota bacterium]